MTRRILGRSNFPISAFLCMAAWKWFFYPGLEGKGTDLLECFFFPVERRRGVIQAPAGGRGASNRMRGWECEGLNVEDLDTKEMGREHTRAQCWVSRSSE
jgi:hypothetical protein